MAVERFTVVALPYSADDDAPFHVSLFISPQLTPDGDESPLGAFPTFVDWARVLSGAAIGLSNQAGPLDVEPLLDVVEPDVWRAVFPEDTPVRGQAPPDWRQRHWRTFRAGEVHDSAKLISAISMAINPTAPGAPDPQADPLVLLMTRIADVGDSGYDESAFTDLYDRIVREPSKTGEPASLRSVERSISNLEGLTRAFAEFHRARRFYERPESAAVDPPVRPIDGMTRDDLPRPDPDFHERVSLLGDHPGVLRRLGLVIDLRVLNLPALIDSEWISASITFEAGLTGMQCRTTTRAIGDDLVTKPHSGEEWSAGRLRIGDESLFRVLNMDVDGAALKTDRFLWTIPRLVTAAEGNADVTAATPAHRTGGFTVARSGRALETQDRIASQVSLGQSILGGSSPLLHTEDVTVGYRIEVYDDETQRWYTLHARRVDAEVLDHGTVLKDVADEGYVQSTTATETAEVEDSPVHVHEAMFSWGGWSLSAPRPGKRVRHEAGEEIVEDPDTDPDPITPIVLHARVEPGTLPRLRYGRSYAFRAWGVDLAGNSRRHDVGPVQPAPSVAVNAVSATVGEPTGFAPSPGLDTELRSESAATVVRRRAASEGPAAVDITDVAVGETNQPLAPEIVARLRTRRAQPLTRMGRARTFADIDRTGQVNRAFEDLILDTGTPLAAGTAVLDAEVVAAAVDVDGDEVLDARTVTPLMPFLRWEPVQPPAVVSRHANSPGESLLQLVIRSGVEQDPDTLDISVTSPQAYAAANPGHRYHAKSERHLVAPKTSQSEAELHGAFDDAIGSTDPDDHRKLLGVAVREAGTLFDMSVPRLDNPNIHDPQPDIALVSDPGVPPSTLKELPLEPGEAPTPGQYITHGADDLRLPYLPDPVARGISLVFQDAGRDRQLVFPFGVEGFTVRYDGSWPEPRSFRLVLESREELAGRLDGRVLRMGLPPGDVQRFRLASSLAESDLDLFGFWRLLPPIIRNNKVIAEAAADGWMWIFTPFDRVTMVHAVPRPLEAPDAVGLRVLRFKGSTDASLFGGIDVHGPSTEQLTAEATWTEYTDDLSVPLPETAEVGGVGFTTVVRPEEDVAILADGVLADQRLEIRGFGPVWLHRAVHQWGDTKHRKVTYQFRAATRYREYFDAATLTPSNGTAGDDGQSVVGHPTTVSVPSSATPAAPIVHSVLPLLRWEVGTEPEQPMAVRRSRHAGVRIYLERPWYSSGGGELLAVLVALGGADKGLGNVVSQWGADPVWLSANVPSRGMFLEFDNLLGVFGLDEPGDARPVAPPVTMNLHSVPGAPRVTVLGYEPQYNAERKLWYVDVAIDAGDKLWPFVRLAVARYQPESLNGCHLSEPVKCDFVQLLPDRTASVSRTDKRHVRVVVSGPIGIRGRNQVFPPPLVSMEDVVSPNRRVLARLQRQDPNIPTNLGWDTVDTVELKIRGTGGSASEAAWVGELSSPVNIPLRKPGSQKTWRVAIEEWEILEGDRADLGERGPRVPERRLIYADEINL